MTHLPNSVRLNQEDKPTLLDLMNQIAEWRAEKLAELQVYERMEQVRENAKTIFDI